MPFTPYHFGPSSWMGVLLKKYIDIPTLMVASVIVDIESLCVVFFNAPWSIHGFLHTFLGGSAIAIPTSITVYLLRKPIKKIMQFFKLAQDSSFKKILWTSFAGVFAHLLLDAFIYKDINPFYPITSNPFFGILSSRLIYLFCRISFIIGVLSYVMWLVFIRKKTDKNKCF